MPTSANGAERMGIQQPGQKATRSTPDLTIAPDLQAFCDGVCVSQIGSREHQEKKNLRRRILVSSLRSRRTRQHLAPLD